MAVKSEADVDRHLARVRSSASRAQKWLAGQDIDALELFRLIKFGPVGFHPVDDRGINLVERINQTWTYVTALAAARQLLKMQPIAHSILNRQPQINDYYFPGHIKESYFNDGSWGKLKQEIDKRSGVSGWQVRDLRRTFRSMLAKLKVPREIAEIALNHVTGAGRNDLDEIYNRYDYLQEKEEALTKLESYVKGLLT